MKAIVLAAGKGERLKNVVDDVPKPMIKVGGKSILEHDIEWLAGFGIKDLYVNLHHKPDVIRNHFGSGARWGVKITYSYEPELLGTAGAVRRIADEYWRVSNRKTGFDPPFLNYEKGPFLVIYGDNLYKLDLQEIISYHTQKKGAATIAVYEKEDVSQSGIVVMGRENRIFRFIEKPKPGEEQSHLVNTGVYVLEPAVLDYIPSNKTLDFGNDVFPEMTIKEEPVYGVVVNGSLIAVDTPALLRTANSEKLGMTGLL